jgi:hypothetical protein
MSKSHLSSVYVMVQNELSAGAIGLLSDVAGATASKSLAMVGVAKIGVSRPPAPSGPFALLKAMEACLERADAEDTPDRIPLISAAFLFAQLAEHLQRSNSLTEENITRCRDATSKIRDDHIRSRIKGLLSEIMG